MSFQAKLKKLGSTYKAASKREATAFGNELEDGRYIARITMCELGESINSGRLQVATEYTIIDGPETNQTIRSYDGLETEDGMYFLQRKLQKLGQQVPDSPEDIPAVLAKIEKEKLVVRIRVKTKGEYQNVYIDRLLGEDVGATGGEEPPAEPQDEGGGEEGEGTGSLDVGAKVTVEVKGVNTEVTITKIVDEETFKAKDAKGKEKTFTTDMLVKTASEEAEGAGVLSLDPGDKIRVKTKTGEITVEVTKIVDDETFKGKGKDGKEKTFTTDQIVL